MAEVESASLAHSSLPDDAVKSPPDTKDMLELDSTGPPKKRRRVAKPNAEKKFECKHEGCGKSYSRAEHLYRHQLNRESYQLVAKCTAIDNCYRHPKNNIPLRLSRLQPLFCAARSVHTPP